MIGKTALALAAAAFVAATAALFVGAAGFALFTWLRPSLGDAGAAAYVALAAGVLLAIAIGLANLPRRGPPARTATPSQASALIATFADTMKERPLLALGLTALTGLAAMRDPTILRDLWAAILRGRDDA